MTEIVRCSSAERFRVEGKGPDDNYGVQEDQAERIATAILTTLSQLDIDSDRVVFHGYSRGSTKRKNDYVVEAQESLRQTAQEANRLQAEGAFEVNPELKQEYVERVANLKAKIEAARDGRQTYHFSDAEYLYDSASNMRNAIHFAGTSNEAFVGVYDRETLQNLGLNQIAADAIHATDEEVESAKIMEFYPRFEILD